MGNDFSSSSVSAGMFRGTVGLPPACGAGRTAQYPAVVGRRSAAHLVRALPSLQRVSLSPNAAGSDSQMQRVIPVMASGVLLPTHNADSAPRTTVWLRSPRWAGSAIHGGPRGPSAGSRAGRATGPWVLVGRCGRLICDWRWNWSTTRAATSAQDVPRRIPAEASDNQWAPR